MSVAMGACGGAGKSAGSGSGVVVTIGANAELTGDGASSFGIPDSHGFELALAEIKDSGYLGDTRLKIESKDNGTDATRAVTNFNQFVSAKTPIVFESAFTPLLQALEPFANNNKTVVMSLFSGGTGTDKDDYVFRMGDFATPLRTLAKYVTADRGVKTIVSVVDKQNANLVATSDRLQKAIQAEGGQAFVKEIAVASADKDFSNVTTQLRSLNPDAVAVLLAPAQSGNFLQQVRSAGGQDRTLFIGQSGWGLQVAKIAGNAAEGAISPQLWVPGQKNSDAFVTAYKQRATDAPPAAAALAHDAVWLVAVAVKGLVAAGKQVTGEALKAALPAASTSPDFRAHALIADFTLNAAGVPTYPGVTAQFRGGAQVPVS